MRPAPVESSFKTNASKPPAFDRLGTPGVVGKSSDVVSPVTQTLTALSSATAKPASIPVPPTYVENMSVLPPGPNLVMNTSKSPARAVSKAPGVTGKFDDDVYP